MNNLKKKNFAEKCFIKLYIQCWLTTGKTIEGKARNVAIIASRFNLEERIYTYRQSGLMRAEKIWWNGINGIHKKLALKISGLKWRPQNGRESKYRMERIMA